MEQRKIGPFKVAPIGLGCMSMSHAYGRPDRQLAERALHAALDCGYDFLDTAALYGFGHNEQLLGEVLSARRSEFVLASKCGLIRGDDGKRAVDGRPASVRQTCEQSLKRLQTEVIDLYYLHRIDPKVPVEESVGELGRLLDEGKIRAIGLSEVNANSLRRACRERPIAALQSEYSLWTRNPEGEVLTACAELGVAFVAFSPLARAFLTGVLTDTATLVEGDLRLTMPRFQPEHFASNLALLPPFAEVAREKDCSMAQLALAWLLHKDDNIIPIPGTTHADYARENFAARQLRLSASDMQRLDDIINAQTVSGERYNAQILASMET